MIASCRAGGEGPCRAVHASFRVSRPNPVARVLPNLRVSVTILDNPLSSMLRKRTAAVSRPSPKTPLTMDAGAGAGAAAAAAAAAEPLLSSAVPPSSSTDPTSQTPDSKPSMSTKTPWLAYAVASGACAAFNGVFAKLYVHYYSISTMTVAYIDLDCTPEQRRNSRPPGPALSPPHSVSPALTNLSNS